MSPTRGALIRLRMTLSFIENGLSILKLKRDRLAEELNLLLKEVSQRKAVEDQLMATYAEFKTALAMLGYSKVQSSSHSINRLQINVKERSVMNVAVPEMRTANKLSIDNVQDASLFKAARSINKLMGQLLHIADIETSIERITYELRLVNRKVNAIEKVVVPSYSSQIKYIEEFLSDEELEEFTRIKRVKTVSQEKGR